MTASLEPLPNGVANLVRACLIGGIVPALWPSRQNKYALTCLIPILLGTVWLYWINKIAPEPYLDEVFHIPQTQRYCEGRWKEWDDKITTPPGLYIVALYWAKLWGRADCSPETLRTFNLHAIAVVAYLSRMCRTAIERTRPMGRPSTASSLYSTHTAVNISFFPILFFFCGLYYTDVLSTCMVLLAYRHHLWRMRRRRYVTLLWSFLADLVTIALGFGCLLLRQTNIFWVVVYFGGLEALDSLKQSRLPVGVYAFTLPYSKGGPGFRGAIKAYASGRIHDPSLNESWPQDVVFCILSVCVGVVCNAVTIVRRVWPHLVVLLSFGCFVWWNGGVVLGDKSNHVATIHLAQLLYIWPLFAFFSAPIMIPCALRLLSNAFKPSRAQLSTRPTRNSQDPWLQRYFIASVNGPILSILVGIAGIGVALLIVHYNTIIHPFTLADNRHYMFYVFRYTILRGSAIRHLLVPAYVGCAFLCWLVLCGPDRYTTANTVLKDRIIRMDSAKIDGSRAYDPNITRPPPVSTVLIFLLATAMSLMTAPLVEPRYFILPWIFWRLLIPAWPLKHVKAGVDLRLILETVWFLVINAATMYVFITRPFYWRAADGTLLDGGQVQRFMW